MKQLKKPRDSTTKLDKKMEYQINYASSVGLYKPSFFQMKVDTIFSLKKLTDLSDEVLSVYLHEYVHYLQDISTTFGLMNASWVVEYMKYSAEKIRKNYEEKFPVPLPIVKEDYHKVYENNLIMNVYAGTNIRLTELVITEIEREIFNVSIDGVNKPLPKVKIHFKDSYGSSTSFFLVLLV